MNKIPKINFRSNSKEFEQFFKIKNGDQLNRMLSYNKKQHRPYDMHITLDNTPLSYDRGRNINFFDSHNLQKLTID